MGNVLCNLTGRLDRVSRELAETQTQAQTQTQTQTETQTQTQTQTGYQNSYRLLLALVNDQNKRHLLAGLQGHEAQATADFLNKVLEEEIGSLEQSQRGNVLHTLSLLARSAQVFPQCLKLRDIVCEFDSKQARRSPTYGEIYKGTLMAKQPVCIKVVPGSMTDYSYQQLLKARAREAILSSHMRHPNVLSFYGLWEFSEGNVNRICTVSAWMENGNLLEYLENSRDPPRELLMSDVISGLAYMHALDIIHSDVQAKNILISNEGRAVIAGFSASRVSIATWTGHSLGGANWVSPELSLGHINTATKQSDMWSYACTCYEIITGSPPFPEFTINMAGLITAFNKGRIPTLTAGSVDEHVLEKLKLCWNYDPLKRPSASDVRDFFTKKLQLEDSKHGDTTIRINPDNTEINYDLVLPILQRVQKHVGKVEAVEDNMVADGK